MEEKEVDGKSRVSGVGGLEGKERKVGAGGGMTKSKRLKVFIFP